VREIVLFVLAIAGAVYAGADKLLAIGKTTASVDKIDRMEAVQNQAGVDSARTKLQVEMMNGTLQEMKSDVHDINMQLRQINITRGNHGQR
jgi:TolA-binding protein